MSVSPRIQECSYDEVMANEVDTDDEGMQDELSGGVCERVALEREDAVVKKMLDPKLPNQDEVDRHCIMGHLPFRSWCPICVKAKGRDLDHKQDTGKERRRPEYSWDYCFPGDELGFKWTVLVGKERGSRSWMAATVPVKGSSGKFAVDKCLEFIEENGDRDGDILVKTDQEPSIQYLIKDLIESRAEGKTVPEESPVRSSGSNGIVERGVSEVEGEIRALFLGLQDRLGRKVDARERIAAFIPEYAAYLMNRLIQGSDGKVAYERLKGKKPSVLGIEFGGKVLCKLKLGAKLEKINARWGYGIFVGVRKRSNELMMMTPDGLQFVRSVRRIPLEKRWGDDCVDWIKWAPWNRYKDSGDADGDVPEGVPVEERSETKGSGAGIVFINTKQPTPRDFYISKKDAEKHGYTKGCPGCSSWFRGLARQPHNEGCRQRFRDLMRDDAKVQNNAARKREFEEKELEKQAMKFLKREERKKRKAENETDDPRIEKEMDVDIGQVEVLVDEWISEIQALGIEEDVDEDVAGAWDDVHGGDLPLKDVKAARREEVGFMDERRIWDLRPIGECWEKTGKPPVSVRWVDTNKGGLLEMVVRSRLVARDFKGQDKDRDDLFAGTPPLEAKRMLFSRAATRTKDGKFRKLLFVDARKAHLNPKCEEDVYILLPEECGCPEGMCGKLNYWLYGFRPAAAAWEKLYCGLLEGVGFARGDSCGVVFYHVERDLSVAVHGDDFTFCGLEEDLLWVRDLMASWFDIKIRAMLGIDEKDDKEVVILGRIVRITEQGIEYEADPKHRRLILEHFGFDDGSRLLSHNGDKDDKEEEWEREDLDKEEATIFRGLAARMNFLGLDCPDLQFPIKQCSREMAKPQRGSWKRMKKIARYLIGRKRIVWDFAWQCEPRYSHVASDSDWGGSSRDRKSTSGGVWMLGDHCIKTWSATQQAYALSSAEAELYGMIEAATRAKGLLSLACELGFRDLSNVVHLGTDSSAAKSFVCRRGLGRMRHLEIRDLWLQKEVRDGRVEVSKIPGDQNPADLMTKILGTSDIDNRLKGMNIRADRGREHAEG